jgi:hypothetical protein
VDKVITSGKSSGPGNMNLELIKMVEEHVLAFVTKLLNKILPG